MRGWEQASQKHSAMVITVSRFLPELPLVIKLYLDV